VGDVTLVWREQDLPPVKTSPWLGLLLIFLMVMGMMMGALAWFGLTHGYHWEATTSPTPIVQPLQTVPTMTWEQQPALEGYTETGHPIYRVVIPAQ
jgi:hypothetical protein